MIEVLASIAYMVIGVSAAPATEPASQPVFEVTEVISYPNAGLSFAVPADWIRRPAPRPDQLYQGIRPASQGPRLSLLVRCEKVGQKSVRVVAEEDAADGRRLRRVVEPKHSGYVPVGETQFYEVAGTSYLARQGQWFVWRYLKRDELCYSVIVSAAFSGPDEQVAASQSAGALADAVCASMKLSKPEDPSKRLYEVSPTEDLARFRLKMDIPEAWRWTRLSHRDPTSIVAVGLMDYERDLAQPALVVRAEYCPPGITAEQIVEGAYRSAVAELTEGQQIDRLFSGATTLCGKPAWDLVTNVSIDKPYTEARRTIVHDEHGALSLIVRYADLNNTRALRMLDRIATSLELLGPLQSRRRGIQPPPGGSSPLGR
ncbi:MAG TPA: hypothetical protein VMZ31_03275 [Phycisphaerae bacterium]|nr:hypothetical protein [Phycisphaerae bacterium]